MATLTTEQVLPFIVKAVDGKGRPADIDGQPKATSSDETVCTVAMADAAGADKSWSGTVTSVAAGTGRITVEADVDVSEAFNVILGVLDIEVTLDERTAARSVVITAGTPADKEV
jgi:hypothetical protein